MSACVVAAYNRCLPPCTMWMSSTVFLARGQQNVTKLIGFGPFLEACEAVGQEDQATFFALRLEDPAAALEALLSLGRYTEASQLAITRRDPEALDRVCRECTDVETRTVILQAAETAFSTDVDKPKKSRWRLGR